MKKIYFNTAATGIVPDYLSSHIPAMLEKLTTDPAGHSMDWLFNDIPDAKKALGRFLHASPESLAIMPNTSAGVTYLISAMHDKLKNVLLYRKDYPSLNLPFEESGFDVSYVDDREGFYIDLEDIEAKIKEDNIDLVAISDVQFLSGFAIDVKKLGELCRQNDCLLLIDATQSMGLLNWELNKTDVDFFIASSYKWIQGGFGTAILYIRDEIVDQFPAKTPGFGSMAHADGDYRYEPSMKSYEPGHPNFLSISILHKSIQYRIDKALENVDHLSYLEMSHFLDLLEQYEIPIIGDYSMNHRAGIVSLPMTSTQFASLAEHGILATHRKGMCRMSIHYYNTVQEVEHVVEVLKEIHT